jgi:hypothetical protein
MSKIELIGLAEWMEQVNGALTEIHAMMAEHSDRLATAEGQNFALKCLLHTFIKREIVPQGAAKVLIQEMIGTIAEQAGKNTYENAYFESAQSLLEELITETQASPPPRPKLTVIDGGKVDEAR